MAEKTKITADTVVTTSELAPVLGVSVRRVQQLIQDGTLVAESKGKLNLADAVQRYIKFLSAKPVDEDDMKIEKIKRTSEAQIKASKATVAKLEAEELKGNMHRSEDVAAMTEELIFAIRSALTALPGRLAVDVAATRTAAEASDVIKKEAHKIMRELSTFSYDPAKYEVRVRERRAWSERDSDEE